MVDRRIDWLEMQEFWFAPVKNEDSQRKKIFLRVWEEPFSWKEDTGIRYRAREPRCCAAAVVAMCPNGV